MNIHDDPFEDDSKYFSRPLLYKTISQFIGNQMRKLVNFAGTKTSRKPQNLQKKKRLIKRRTKEYEAWFRILPLKSWKLFVNLSLVWSGVRLFVDDRLSHFPFSQLSRCNQRFCLVVFFFLFSALPRYYITTSTKQYFYDICYSKKRGKFIFMQRLNLERWFGSLNSLLRIFFPAHIPLISWFWILLQISVGFLWSIYLWSRFKGLVFYRFQLILNELSIVMMIGDIFVFLNFHR
jgi:hypothetical protein